MSLYESVSSYVVVYGCIWWCNGVYAPIWMYMKVYDGIGM